jgi:hypothetical protein
LRYESIVKTKKLFRMATEKILLALCAQFSLWRISQSDRNVRTKKNVRRQQAEQYKKEAFGFDPGWIGEVLQG